MTHAQLVARAAAGTGTNQLRSGVVGTLDQAGFPHYTTAPDGYPVTTDIDFRMLVGYACNADRYEDWITNPLPIQNASHGIVTTPPFGPQNPLQRDVAGNMFITGQIQDAIATHTASDIVLSAFGRGAGLFTGVMDNTDVFFKVARVAMGDNRIYQEIKSIVGNPVGRRLGASLLPFRRAARPNRPCACEAGSPTGELNEPGTNSVQLFELVLSDREFHRQLLRAGLGRAGLSGRHAVA